MKYSGAKVETHILCWDSDRGSRRPDGGWCPELRRGQVGWRSGRQEGTSNGEALTPRMKEKDSWEWGPTAVACPSCSGMLQPQECREGGSGGERWLDGGRSRSAGGLKAACSESWQLFSKQQNPCCATLLIWELWGHSHAWSSHQISHCLGFVCILSFFMRMFCTQLTFPCFSWRIIPKGGLCF